MRTRRLWGVCAKEVPECKRSCRPPLYRWLTVLVDIDQFEPDPRLLSGAIEAARKALRRMDEEHVPAGLRAIAGRSGRLPPPLAKKLLAALDDSEWLRSEALAVADLDPASSDRSTQASAIFLGRVPGWEEQLAALAQEKAVAQQGRAAMLLAEELGGARRRIERLEAELALASERHGEIEREVEERLAGLAERQRRARLRLKADVKRLQGEIAELRDQLAAEQATSRDLRLDLERLNRRPPAPVPAVPARTKGAWELATPLQRARHLDDLMVAGQVAPAPAPASAGPIPAVPARLPAGLSPDRADALKWLLGHTGDLTVIVDGWNAAHLLASTPTVAERDRVVEAGRRLLLGSLGRRRVLVVFDSREGTDTYSSSEVEVRYVESADDEILALAAAATSALVVISSDRRVREGAEAAGAIGLWSEALVDWLAQGGRRTFRT